VYLPTGNIFSGILFKTLHMVFRPLTLYLTHYLTQTTQSILQRSYALRRRAHTKALAKAAQWVTPNEGNLPAKAKQNKKEN
jgi:hypothetical protein